MSVFIDGSTLSSILYSHANSAGNQEGVLLGQVVREVKDHISDSQINNSQVHTFIYVASHIPWPTEDRVYSRGGVPIMEKMAALLGNGHTQEEVVGWYSFRRNSTLRMSMKERTLHKHLEARFSRGQADQFLFLMCGDSCNTHCSTHSMDHFFATITPGSGAMKKLSVSVTNLGDTLHTQYKTLAHSAATQSTAVRHILKDHTSQFMSSTGGMQEVQRINDMSKALNSNLMRLCKQVCESEQHAGELEREVTRLREELARREVCQKEQSPKEKNGEEDKERESSVDAGHLYPSLEPQRQAWGEEENREQHRLVVQLDQNVQPPPADKPSVDDLLSMPVSAPASNLDLTNLHPAPPPTGTHNPPVPGGPVLQSVVDTITDTDEEENLAAVSDAKPALSTQHQVTGHKGQCEVNNAKNRKTASAAGSRLTGGSLQSKTAGGVKSTTGSGTKQSTPSSESGTKSKDHFSFVDNLLSTESASVHKKSTATVPTGATLTYSPRTTRSQVKVSTETTTTKERSKTRNSPTRSFTSQAKRESSPKADGKARPGSASRVSGLSAATEKRRAGRTEGGPTHDKVNQNVTSNKDAQGTKLTQNSRQDSHSRVKLDPANFALGGRPKIRTKVGLTRVVSKSDSDSEKMDCGVEEPAKNGNVNHVQEDQEGSRSLSPVF